TDEPTTEEPTTEEPTTEEPTADASSVTLGVTDTASGTTLETDDGTLETENGIFLGFEIEVTNESDQTIGLRSAHFTFYDSAGDPYPTTWGQFSTSGPEIPAGETAVAQVYADVPDAEDIVTVTYSDPVGTGGEEAELSVE